MMKRGLSTLDVARTPVSRYRARQEQMRQAVEEAGLDAALIYGDVSAGADIAYLTHTTLYWGNAIFMVPANDATVLVMTLSPRTQDWFRGTSVLDEMISGPNMASIVQKLVADRGYSRLGIVGQDFFPAEMLREIKGETGIQLRNLGSLVRDLRAVPDEVAFADLADAARLGLVGMNAAVAAAGSRDSRLIRAETEFAMRSSGAWDATAVVIEATSGGMAVQLRCQIRDAWYGAERILADPDGDASTGHALFDDLLAQLRPGVTETALREYVRSHADAALGDGVMDVVLEGAPDVEQRQVFGEPSDGGFPDGSVVHLALWAWSATAMPVTALGDTFRVTPTGAVALAE